MFKVITGTLQANHNTMQITENIIHNSYIYEVYVNSNSDIIPQSISVSGHTLTVTFDSAPTNNVVCKILLFDEYISSSDIAYRDGEHTPTVETVLNGMTEELEDFDRRLTNVSTTVISINNKVPSDTVVGGVLYHATTGNTWKKLDASNIDYDSGSTIYSAMGDLDELETESKNLVGAINELNNKPSGGAIIIDTTENIIGKFMGKDLYCKMLTGNVVSGVTTINHGIENIDDLVDYSVYRLSPDGAGLIKGYGTGPDETYNVLPHHFTKTEIQFKCNKYNTGTYRIILVYTKIS